MFHGDFGANSFGFQPIQIEDIMPGDILWYQGHVEIYAGDDGSNNFLVYNAGGTASIRCDEIPGYPEASYSHYSKRQVREQAKIFRPGAPTGESRIESVAGEITGQDLSGSITTISISYNPKVETSETSELLEALKPLTYRTKTSFCFKKSAEYREKVSEIMIDKETYMSAIEAQGLSRDNVGVQVAWFAIQHYGLNYDQIFASYPKKQLYTFYGNIFPYKTGWCTEFASHCYYKNGLIGENNVLIAPFRGEDEIYKHVDKGNTYTKVIVENGIERKIKAPTTGKERCRFKTRKNGYIPCPGDMIFIGDANTGEWTHVAIVMYCDGKYVYTVDGNQHASGDYNYSYVTVGTQRKLTDNSIFGYYSINNS